MTLLNVVPLILRSKDARVPILRFAIRASLEPRFMSTFLLPCLLLFWIDFLVGFLLSFLIDVGMGGLPIATHFFPRLSTQSMTMAKDIEQCTR